MLVGAYRPRQNTAFALEELSVMVAAKDARAAQSKKSTRINFLRLGIAYLLYGANLDRSDSVSQAFARSAGDHFPAHTNSPTPPDMIRTKETLT
jgi:hypothetical protein